MAVNVSSPTAEVVPHEFTLEYQGEFTLECGKSLTNPRFAVQKWGNVESATKTVWVCHALTGNHRVHEWWDGLFGMDKCFDPNHWNIICVNVLGSCYGSEGPVNPSSPEKSLLLEFPLITIKDMVKGLEFVRETLQIDEIDLLIGASVGGQQALEWITQFPERFKSFIPIATNVKHSPFGIAFNEAQRLALEADQSFRKNPSVSGGRSGLIAARSIGMISYRTYQGYAITQKETESKFDEFKASSYQKYQGEKLANRFNAYSYWYLSKAMDSHDLGRGSETIENRLLRIKVPTLVIGIDSDLLFPIQEQEFIAANIKNAQLLTLSSNFGHDGFLVEFEPLDQSIRTFIKQNLN